MAQERTIPIGCGSIHARWWGPDTPDETVVLLHGGPGITERYMEPIVPFLDDGRRRIVSYDQRGVGESRCDSTDPADFGFDAHADDLSRVIDEIAVGPVHLIKTDVVGNDHVRLIAGGQDGGSFKAIAFRMAASELGQALLHGAKGRRLWLAGRAKIDDWGSRPQAELHLEDAAWAD